MNGMHFTPSSYNHSRGGEHEITIQGSFSRNANSYSQSAKEADNLLSSNGKGIIGSSATIHIRDDLTHFSGDSDSMLVTEYELESRGNYIIEVRIHSQRFAEMLCCLMNGLPIEGVIFPDPMEFNNGDLLRYVKMGNRKLSSLVEPTLTFGQPKIG